MNDPIVGIDLGTSNSVVAHADAAGIVKVLADDSGNKVHPSVVSFHPNGGVVIGAAAKQRKVIDPSNTIYSVKRLIGRSYRSPEVQTAKARSPFQIKEGQNNAPLIVTRGGEFAVPEISAIVLDHVRNIASARLDCAVNRAVVTVPASFNDAQRSATATAGAIAGLTVVRVLNEPTAAALAYGHTRQLREIIAVYDFGGGTFDITILKLDDQVYEVLGTSGDTFLGGDDLDERLVDRMVAKFLAENRIDLRTNEVAMMRLRAVAEQTKIELSRRSRAVVRIDEIAYGARGAPLNLQIEITRDEFVKEVADLVDRTFPVCTEALALANLSVDRIADVILVGGTTKIPYVRDQVGRYFGKLPRADVNPEDAVAAGAALQATALERLLSRRTSSISSNKAPTPSVAETSEVTAVTNDLLELAEPLSGATMAPSELTLATPTRTKRPTAAYPTEPNRVATEQTKPDTSYSVTRPGVRDQVADRDRYRATPPGGRPAAASGFETRMTTATQPSIQTPPAEPVAPDSLRPSLPLGRITKPVPAVSPPSPTPVPPTTVSRTLFGVPAAPAEIDVDMDSAGVTAADPLPPVLPPVRSPALPGPPPLPPSARRTARAAQAVLSTAQLPTVQRPPLQPATPSTPLPVIGSFEPSSRELSESEDWSTTDSSAGTNPAAWLIDEHRESGGGYPAGSPSPATTQPLAPVRPISPPTEPTLVALAPDHAAAMPRGPNAQTLLGAPATTARGFQAPQSFPIQPPPLAPRPPPIVLEVTPRGLGIATVAGYCEELIRRNSRLPTEIRKLFTTSRDQQDLVRIVVCQGESRRLDNNTVIGDLILQGLPRRPRGETSIEVTFSLDASGVLNVRARDAQTGAEQRASLDLVGGVAQEDVAVSRDRLQQLRR